MADQSQQPTVTDPDNVGELSCNGPVNVSIVGDRAVLTFTHVRPDATALFRDGTMNPIMIVRARIVITLENLNALRDLFNRLAQSGGPNPSLFVCACSKKNNIRRIGNDLTRSEDEKLASILNSSRFDRHLRHSSSSQKRKVASRSHVSEPSRRITTLVITSLLSPQRRVPLT